MKLAQLLAVAPGWKLLQGDIDLKVKGVAETASTLKKGEIFICVKGYAKDGHDFAKEAVKRGAVALIVERPVDAGGKTTVIRVPDSKAAMFAITDLFYADAKKKLKIIGVTGTKGKTTVTYLVEAILKEKHKKDCAVLGTIGFKIGRKIYKADNTTPSNITIHRLLAEAADKGIKYAIIESSSHALDQGRLKNISFDAAVMTNVTRDHFDYHGNFRNYLAAKLIIVKENLKKGGLLAVNADSKGAKEFIKAGQSKKAEIIRYAVKNKAEISLLKHKLDIDGMNFELMVQKRVRAFFTSILVGQHNIYNIMAAIAATSRMVDIKSAVMAIKKFTTVKGRLDKIYSNEFNVIVDFAHTPDSLEQILRTLNELKKGRIITVFGAGGERDRGKRPMMGAAVEKYADLMIVTSDNPRSEDPASIITEVMAGVKNKDKALMAVDRGEAIRMAVKAAKKDDIILLAGKGHEEYQIIGDTKFDFNDAKEALKAIKELR
jgi:UDP-N-acetylmuramoyl-L-alanyl-D-glutamate--2,6-diaminopimelate ligase